MKKRYLLFFLLAFGLAHAAVPVNDDCASAIELTPGSTCTPVAGTSQDATNTVPSAICASAVNSDVWYKFTATTTDATITVLGSVDFDAVIELHGDCSGTNVLECSDFTANGNTETINAESLTIGNVYYVRVAAYGASLPGSFDFTICVVEIPVATNDNCASAQMLSTSLGACGAYTNGYLSITGTGANGCIGDANDDVWYSFVATGADMNIDVTAGFDVVLEVFSGTCGSLTQMQCTDFNSIGLNGLTTNETYFFRVYEYGTGVPTNKNFSVCEYEILIPEHDDCANAEIITPGVNNCGTSSNGTLLGATGNGGCTGDANDDVWYKVQANGTSMIFTVSGSFATVIEVQTSCGGSVVACSNSSSLQVNGLTNGSEYFIRIYDYFTSPPVSPTFSICAYSVDPPVNDACSNATALVVGAAPVGSTLLGATADGYSACQGVADDDVWFSFTATTTTHAVKIENTSISTVTSLYSTCGGSVIACSDFPTLTANALSIGTTYLVRVHSIGDFTVSVPNFEISVYSPIANDNCGDAIALVVNAAPVTATSTNATQSVASCSGFADDDVWFSYVPTFAADDTILCVGSSGYDAVLEVFDACGGNSLYCNDGAPSGGTEQIITANFATGQTYYIRVYHYSNLLPGTPDFTIQVKHGIVSSTDRAVVGESYNVYPNPTSGELNIRNISIGTTIELFNVHGTVLYQYTANAESAAVDMTRYAGKGMYHLRLSDGEKVAVHKIIITD